MKTSAYLVRISQSFLNNVGLCGRCNQFSHHGKSGMYSYASGCGIRFISQIVERVEEVSVVQTAEEVLRKWGCDDKIVARIFQRHPALRKAVPKLLASKLNVLSKFGVGCSDLVKMIHHRPRILSCRINQNLEERLQHFQSLFGGKEVVVKAIVRNPSLLVYKLHEEVEPIFSMYEQLGIEREDFVSMLLLRPTIISRTKICEGKLDYIRRTGVTKDAKMYKYVVSIIGVSRLATIREKVSNLEKYGFSEDEVLQLFGRSPLLMTLSVDKVQRNMTFVVGTMKLPASAVVGYPFLLFVNLEKILKPRVLLAGKIQDMGLQPQMNGPMLFRALRMTEKRFLEVFVRRHGKGLKNELFDYYKSCQGVTRLAASSRKSSHAWGFPF